jgi:predicted DNA-binding protein with PD1-like motif
VHTTAEIVICEIPDVKFGRAFDEKTGYRELMIHT